MSTTRRHGAGYDGGYGAAARRRAPTSPTTSPASRTWPPARRTLREHLGEQIRLTFADAARPADRGAAARAGGPRRAAGRRRTRRWPRRWAARWRASPRCAPGCSASTRSGMFCRDLRECLAVQLAEQNRLDPAMQALLDNLDLLARRDRRGLMRVCGVDAEDLAEMIAELRRLDPKPGASFDAAPAPARGAGRPDAPGAGRRLGAGAEPGDPAARAGEPRLPRPRPARRPHRARTGPSWPSACRAPTGWSRAWSSAPTPS